MFDSVPKTISFVSIPVDSLRIDTVLDFPLFKPSVPDDVPAFQSYEKLYWRSGSAAPPIQYRRKSFPFTAKAREQLRSASVETLLIDVADEQTYNRHLQCNLGSLLGSASTPLVTRAFILYRAACGLMRDVFEDTISVETTAPFEGLVRHAVEFVVKAPGRLPAFAAMMPTAYAPSTHSVNVLIFSLCLARHTDFPLGMLMRLGLGALLHDVGLTRVSPETLAWRGRLNGRLLRDLQSHTVHGLDVLREWGMSDEVVLDIVHHHHEQLDGSGYPDRLDANQMDVPTRVVTVTDQFDTLTTGRPEREGLSSFEALKHMKYELTSQLPQDLVDAFIQLAGASSRQ